jgi:hypothetical protein
MDNGRHVRMGPVTIDRPIAKAVVVEEASSDPSLISFLLSRLLSHLFLDWPPPGTLVQYTR